MEKLGSLAGFNIFAEVEKKLKEKEEKPEWCIVMNNGMFVTQRHKCYTWEQYRRKSKHNKDAKRLREHFNKSDLFYMFRQMEKLIELLNEHRREKVNKQSGITQWHYNGYTFSLDNLKAQQAELLIISKQYGFIKWLVENEKIMPLRKFIGWETDEDEPYIQFDLVDQYIAYLSIQDEPIEFLVSILK